MPSNSKSWKSLVPACETIGLLPGVKRFTGTRPASVIFRKLRNRKGASITYRDIDLVALFIDEPDYNQKTDHDNYRWCLAYSERSKSFFYADIQDIFCTHHKVSDVLCYGLKAELEKLIGKPIKIYKANAGDALHLKEQRWKTWFEKQTDEFGDRVKA